MRASRVLFALAAACASGGALAHGGLGNVAPFYSGLFHVLVSPVAWAAILGTLLAVGASREAWVVPLLAASALGACAGVLLQARLPPFAVPACLALLGACAVLALRANTAGACVLACVGSLAAGAASELDALSFGSVCGVTVLVTLLVTGVLSTPVDAAKYARLRAAAPLARRIAGSWVLALGLLQLALAVRKG